MSMAPPVTKAKQTAATNMTTYFRNSRPRNARKGVPPPGSSAKDFIRLHLRRPGGKAGRFGLLRWVTIPCWRAPIGEKSHPACFFVSGRGREKATEPFFWGFPFLGYFLGGARACGVAGRKARGGGGKRTLR